jgi:hypothetical protein
MNTDLHRSWVEEYAQPMAKDYAKCCIGTCAGRVQRWPGFVGPDFAAGGVMLVGLKHNGEQLFAPVAMQFYSA